MPDALVERLWSIIQHMSGGASSSAAGMTRAQVRPDAPIAALGILDTKDMAKKLNDELLQEAQAKAGPEAAHDPSASGRRADDEDR